MDRIWWERVPNALQFLNDLTGTICSGKSIIIQSDSSIPWKNTMMEELFERIRLRSYQKRLELLENVDDPGDYLLQEFCKKEKRVLYRPNISYAAFFAANDDIVLHDRFFWVKISDEDNLSDWTDFISEYRRERAKSKDKRTAVFILEWKGKRTAFAKKGIHEYSLSEYIGEYDRIVFNSLAAASVKEPLFIKTYLSQLASEVIDNDIELCAACIKDFQAFLKDPYSVIQEVISRSAHENGEPFFFDRSPQDISHCIWKAQIKMIYPLLEEYRENFVRKYFLQIKPHLPIKTAYNEQYLVPEDVELGTLHYMASCRLLQIPQNEYEELTTYKTARNKLSHLENLSFDEVKKLNC